MRIEFQALTAAIHARFQEIGIPHKVSEVVVEHLTSNERIGRSSHGLVRLLEIVRAGSAGEMATECELHEVSAGSYVVEAGGLPGIYAMWFAAQELTRVVRERGGVVAVGVRGYRGTTGNVGLFVWESARSAVPAVAFCNSGPVIAAPGATNPLVGTNPIAFGFQLPSGDVMVGDFASSVWAYGEVALRGMRGAEVPDGVVIDAAGNPSRRAADAEEGGSLLASGGHKGFVQALMIELLCGALVGGKVGSQHGAYAGLLIGFEPNAFGNGAAMALSVEDMASQIRSAQTASGRRPPHVPGTRYARLLAAPPKFLEIDDALISHARMAGIVL